MEKSFLCKRFFTITLILTTFFYVDRAQAQLQMKLKQTKEKLGALNSKLGSLKQSLVTLKSTLEKSESSIISRQPSEYPNKIFTRDKVEQWLNLADATKESDKAEFKQLIADAAKIGPLAIWNLISAAGGEYKKTALMNSIDAGTDRENFDLIINAAKTIDDDAIFNLLKIQDGEGNTVLHKAVENIRKDLIKKILELAEYKAENLKSITNEEGLTAYGVAKNSSYDDEEVLNLLNPNSIISKKDVTDLRLIISSKPSPLFREDENIKKNVEILILLSKVVPSNLFKEFIEGVKTNSIDDKDIEEKINKWTSLTKKNISDDLKEFIKDLKTNGQKMLWDLLSAKSKSYGNTILMDSIRVRTDHADFDLLIDAAKTIDKDAVFNLVKIQNNEGATVLHKAVWAGQTDIVKKILELAGEKADDLKRIKNKSGQTPIDLGLKMHLIGKDFKKPETT